MKDLPIQFTKYGNKEFGELEIVASLVFKARKLISSAFLTAPTFDEIEVRMKENLQLAIEQEIKKVIGVDNESLYQFYQSVYEFKKKYYGDFNYSTPLIKDLDALFDKFLEKIK